MKNGDYTCGKYVRTQYFVVLSRNLREGIKFSISASQMKPIVTFSILMQQKKCESIESIH